MNNYSISTRLNAGFAAVLILMLAIAGMGIVRLQAVGDVVHKMSSETMAIERLAAEWFTEISVNSAHTVAVAKTDEPESQEYFIEKIAASRARISAIQKNMEPMITSVEGRALLQHIAEKRSVYATIGAAVLDLKRTGRNAVADQMIEEKFLPAVDAYLHSARQLIAYQQNVSLALARQADAHFQDGSVVMASLSAAALLLGLACAWLISRSISRPLNAAVRVAQRVAAGDLSAQIVVSGTDETGQLLAALRDMNSALHQVIGNVRHGTDTIATASGQIAAGNMDLSSRTEQQASALEETAASMEELTSTVKQNADNAHQANELALSASQVAEKGGAVVAQVVDTMASINDSSRKINDIIGVIDGIAFQTNILALNAAVEAARAGEQGRGFAVVATEVRNLAQRSASAAKEIKTLIGDSVEKVDQGAKLVDQAGATMEEIVASIRRVTDIMGDISAASREQTAGIEQVNQAISQMDQVTQQNAALVEEAAAASEALQEQTIHLAQTVSVFTLGNEADAEPATVAMQAQQHRVLPAAGSRRRIEKPVFGPDKRLLAVSYN
jgi:methyl-accepting chemotaxis protein